MLLVNGNVRYFESKSLNEDEFQEYSLTNYPSEIQKKITILQHFNKNMKVEKYNNEENAPYIKK